MAATLVDERAAAVHRAAFVIDGLNVSKWSREQFQRMKTGGLTAANCTLAIWDNFRETISEIAAWYKHFRENADLILPVHTVEDIHRARAEGRVGIIFGFQNSTPFEDDLRTVEVLYRLGVRICQLTYNTKNFVGDGCWERNDGGLSYFGIDVIREMNRVGMLVDLSHVGYRTTMDAIEVSESPCAFTHAGCRAVTDVPRNKTDEQLRALTAKGGVVGIVGVPIFLTHNPTATLDDYLRHVDYAVNLVGVDHVAVGTDHGEGHGKAFFDLIQYGKGTIPYYQWTGTQAQAYPEEISSISKQANLTAALLKRGYGDDDVKKIMGGNWVRLFGEVWGA
ncbi:MAG: membrane dipeptidase [Chloroflexi bacterium]|nr:membrane dipeptidase [Chloroflexota bacterium]